MKPPRALSTTIAALLLASSALAVDGTWVGPGSGNFGDTTKWTGGTVASGTDAVATVDLGASGNTTITIDSNVTLGTLQATNSSGGDFNLIGNGTNTLTFARSAGTPLLSLSTYFGKFYQLGTSGGTLAIAGTQGLTIDPNSLASGNRLAIGSSVNWSAFSGTLTNSRGWIDPQAASVLPQVHTVLGTSTNAAALGLTNGRSQTIGGLDGNAQSFIYNNSGTASTLTLGAGNDSGTFAGTIGSFTYTQFSETPNLTTAGGLLNIVKSGTGTQTITGNLVDAGANASAVTVNAGTLVLSGTNTYAGLFTVNSGGTLKTGSASALGTTTGVTKVNSGGVLDLNGQTLAEQFGDTTSNDGFTGTGISSSGALINSAAAVATITGNIYSNAAYTVGAGDITLSGAVGRRNGGVTAVMLTKTGTGTLTIGGTADNGTLLVTVNSGTVVLGKSSTASSRAAGEVTVSGGTLKFDPTLGAVTGSLSWGGQINGTVTVNGGTVDLNGSSGQNSRLQQLVGTGGIITNTSTTAATLGIAARDSNTTRSFSGTIQDGAGTVALDFTATGALNSGRVNFLSGSNSYSGGTSIGFGTVRLGSDTALGSGKVSLTGSAGVLDLNGRTMGNALANSGTGATITNSSASLATTNGTMSETVISDFTVNGTGNIEWNGNIARSSGVGTITKNGANTLALDGSVSGMNLSVAAGTLLVNGSASGSTATVSGGTLGGSGSVGAVAVNTAGTLAPGVGLGIFAASSLSLSGAAQFKLEINTSTVAADLMNVGGNLSFDLGNTVVLSITDLGTNVALAPNSTFTLIDYGGVWNGGTFSGLADDSTVVVGVNQFRISYNGLSGSDTAVTLQVVPEPNAWVAMLGGMGLLVGSRRIRRRTR